MLGLVVLRDWDEIRIQRMRLLDVFLVRTGTKPSGRFELGKVITWLLLWLNEDRHRDTKRGYSSLLCSWHRNSIARGGLPCKHTVYPEDR